MTRIEIPRNQEQIELLKAMASPDRDVAAKAQQSFAAAMGPVISQVLNMSAASKLFFTDWPYDEDDAPTFPLDQYYGTAVDHVTIWQQSIAGGAGTSLLGQMKEMPLATYRLDTAWAFLTKNLQRGRLPSVALGLNRATQELVAKHERNAWTVVTKALAEATTNGTKHVISAGTANQLKLDDFNNLITLGKRINTAFNGGTPATTIGRGLTHMVLSPERMEDVRAFVYQPMNTVGAPAANDAGGIALPDNIREEIYRAAGNPSVYGINLVELLEFGDGQRYNQLFATFAAANGITFNGATDDLVLGIDASRGALLRPVAMQGGSTEVAVEPDDQFSRRSGKVGFFAYIECGAVCIDSRALVGLKV